MPTACRARRRSLKSSRRHFSRTPRIWRRSCSSRVAAGSAPPHRGSGAGRTLLGRHTETAMALQLKGRIALITGPAKGMGAAITMAFAAEGAKLALAGRDVAAVEPVAQEVRGLGADAIVVPCDLTDAKQCEQAAAATSAAYGRIDILVNVAGGSGAVGKTGVETTPVEFDDIVTLNMNGCFHTMLAALPAMMAQRYGKIVNVRWTFC